MKVSCLIVLWLFPPMVVSLADLPLFAQVSPEGAPISTRGKITTVKGRDLMVAVTTGELSVRVTDGTRIVGEVAAKLTDIAPGVYLGTTAQKQSDGTFLASEVHIFADHERGLSEGHRPSSSTPNSTMTNASVEKIEEVIVQEVKGPMLGLKYKGGEVKVFLPPNIPIVRRVNGNQTMLKSGAEVRIQGSQSPDGTVLASQITVRAPGS